MKNALVILLALTMVMSMFAIVPFGASAAEDELAVGAVAADYTPEGTAINTAEDFAAMTADGKYYLAADITVNATYPESFTGTFDGNGKKITTTTALFAALDGTVKNLTIMGDIDYTVATTEHKAEGYTGALASIIGHYAPANVTNVVNKTNIYAKVGAAGGVVGMVSNDKTFAIVFDKVVNYGDVVSTSGDDNGGIAAWIDGDDKGEEFYIQFVDCANYGVINAVGHVGGIIGYSNASTKLVNCYNAGDITSSKGNDGVGGIAGILGGPGSLLIDGCVNDGKVTAISTARIAGGIVGSTSDTSVDVKFINCINNGDVTATVKNSSSPAGGIVGWIRCYVGSGSGYEVAASLVGCINHGNVTSISRSGGLVGLAFSNSNHLYLDIYQCGNIGKVVGDDATGGLVGRINFNAAAAKLCRSGVNIIGSFNIGDISGNKYVAGLVGYTPMSGPATIAYNYVAGDIKSGIESTPIKSGETVSEDTIYSIESNTHGVLYFIAPTSGKLTLSSDDVVTVTASSSKILSLTDENKNIQSGTTVKLNTTYSYTDKKGDVWGFYALKNGMVIITEPDGGGKPTVVIDDTEIYVMPLPSNDNKTIANVKTFTTPITFACALVYNRMNCRDLSTNYVLEGTADGIYAVQGFGCLWFALDFVLENDDNTFTAEELANGTLAYKLNEAIGEMVFYQNIDPELFEVDAYPTTDKTHAKVVYINGEYQNQVFDTANDSGSPATGDATVYVVVSLAVSTIALAAVAVVRKKKEN